MTLQVLTVDDSPTVREMIGDTLSAAGYNVLKAEDGEQGLRVLGSNPVDLIITDINMMVMGGFDFIREVRSDDSYDGTPILVMTTEISEDFKQLGRELGATGWIAKPFDPDKLIKVIQQVTH